MRRAPPVARRHPAASGFTRSAAAVHDRAPDEGRAEDAGAERKPDPSRRRSPDPAPRGRGARRNRSGASAASVVLFGFPHPAAVERLEPCARAQEHGPAGVGGDAPSGRKDKVRRRRRGHLAQSLAEQGQPQLRAAVALRRAVHLRQKTLPAHARRAGVRLHRPAPAVHEDAEGVPEERAVRTGERQRVGQRDAPRHPQTHDEALEAH
mmetsp:Transcript_33551/g.107202  ORF Transcript_33551/g.107202 Transcript_33551/m.107202 type:complete len:208 (+) Transcript_33551:768-1391(+)